MSCEPKSPHGPQISDALSSCRESASGRKIIDPLEEILLLVPCAVISGADGWTSIPLYGQKKLEFLRRFLPFEVTIQIPQRRSTHPESPAKEILYFYQQLASLWGVPITSAQVVRSRYSKFSVS